MIRVAAAGDLHLGPDSVVSYRPLLSHLHERADVLLLAGDLTQHGSAEEFLVLAGELAGLSTPVAAVLGNHDYHQNKQAENRRILEAAGVHVLEGEPFVLEIGREKLGVAGVKGFCGGYSGSSGVEFGEPEMKTFIKKARRDAGALARALEAVAGCDVRVALTHYSPIKGTLVGERLELYPFLGSYLLAEAIDEARADLALHGHAHKGTGQGVTPGGVPVRNVAMPLLGTGYQLFSFSSGAEKKAGPRRREAGLV